MSELDVFKLKLRKRIKNMTEKTVIIYKIIF